MKKVISLIITIGVFIGWMSLVGSPSETETIIGLCISGGVGLWVCNKLGCLDI